MSHGDEAAALPAGFHRTAVTANALAGIVNEERRIWAVQFHPEVHHTPLGPQLIRNFVFNICGAAATGPRPTSSRPRSPPSARRSATGHVICGLSGGVDSSVAAVLVHQAIGSQLTCIFVNNGVLRKNEFQNVQKNLRDNLGLNIVAVDASQRFLAQLAGVTTRRPKASASARSSSPSSTMRPRASPKKPAAVDWLVQGTLYPDVIESSSVKGPARPSRATTTWAGCRWE